MPLLDSHLEQIALSSNAISDLPYVNHSASVHRFPNTSF